MPLAGNLPEWIRFFEDFRGSAGKCGENRKKRKND
jgi:hypothetical protein